MTLSRFVRLTAILLIPAMFSNNLAFAAKNPVDPASVKAKLQSRGVGHGVRVTMADNTEAKGLIVSLGDQSFAVKSKGAAQPREIQYAQVIGVHNDKIRTGTKIVIAVVIAGAVVGIVAAVAVHKFDNSFKPLI